MVSLIIGEIKTTQTLSLSPFVTMAEIAYVCRLNNEERTFRARLDPFDEFNEVKCRQRYRVSKDVAMELATDLEASQWSTLDCYVRIAPDTLA